MSGPRERAAAPGIVVRLLLHLHPASFRERWGPSLAADATAAGPGAWSGLVASAVGMWLHPVVWPAESGARRRHRAAAMAVAVALASCFVGRAATANDRSLTWRAHPVWNVADCAALMLLGVLLLLPLPRPTRYALATLLRRALRALAAPALLGTGALVFVHAAHPAQASAPRLAVTAYYWLTLALTAIQAARVVGTITPAAVTPPSPARLRLGLAILTAGGTLASWVSLSSVTAAGTGFDTVSATTGASLLALTCLLFSLLRDLDHCSAT